MLTMPVKPVTAQMCQGWSNSAKASSVSTMIDANETNWVIAIRTLRFTTSANAPPYITTGICNRLTAPRMPSCAADPVVSYIH